MIATIGQNGEIVFDLDIQSPWDWIDCVRAAFPNTYVGSYDTYEDCLWFAGIRG